MVDPVQQKLVTQSILDYLKNLKENFVPKLILSEAQVTETGISYGDIRIRQVEIENAGDGLLEFEITAPKATWMAVEPLRGVVKAGEKIKISIKITIGQKEAQHMFMHKDVSEEVIIQTNEPQKHTIKVQFEYQRGCFGASLVLLNQCTAGPSLREELQSFTREDIMIMS